MEFQDSARGNPSAVILTFDREDLAVIVEDHTRDANRVAR